MRGVLLETLNNYILLATAFFIIFTVIKQLLIKCTTLKIKDKFPKIKFPASKFKKPNLRLAYLEIVEYINNNKFHSANWAVFLIIIVKEAYFKKLVAENVYIGYLILFWFLSYAIYWSYKSRISANKDSTLKTSMQAVLNLLFFSIMWLSFIDVVSKNMDFILVIVAILFCFIPSFFMAMTMLDCLEYSLARISIAYIFTIIVGAYTLLIFGIHDKVILGESIEGDFISSVLTLIKYGADNISQSSLPDITENRLDRLLQVLIGIFGGFAISYVTSVANKPKA